MFFNSGIRGARARDGVGSVANRELFVQKKDPVPSITSWAIQGSDDTSLDPAGGQTVVVTGTGFASGLTGIVGSTTLASVTVVSATTATFTSTAKSAGSYTLILSNASGAAAIYVPGITYSSIPTYTTAAGSIGSNYETTAINTQVVATSDSAITYSLATGALPSGSTLYANGVITGTAPVDSSSTTYSFSITATDAELQDVTRSFTLTINTDVVTWSSPGSGTTYTVVGNTPISNVTLSATSAAGYGVTYAANALPTGLTLSSGVISGTPTTEANTTSLLTATASTTNRSATNTIYWVVTLNDAYFKYNSLLMSSTVVTNTFATDLSSNNLDITINGDTKPSKFDPFELGYYSGYFDGSTSKLTLSTNAAFNMGSGDFTVEAWVYWAGTSTSYQNIVGSNSASFAGNATFFRVWGSNAGGVLGSKIGIGNPTHDGASSVYSTNSLVANTWNHVAATRASSIIKVFINGNLEKTGSTDTSTYDFGDNGLVIGDAPWDGAAGWYSGYISNARLVKGTALYTTTFTPSTTPLTAITNTSLLTCQSSRFVDNSANAFAITVGGNTAVNPFQPFTPDSSYATYGSTLFDGTGDRLSINGADPGINLTTNNFTLECWVYASVVNAEMCIINKGWQSSSAYASYLIYITSGASLRFNSSSAGSSWDIANEKVIGTMTAGTWTHIAVTRSGTTFRAFVNGVINDSFTFTSSASLANIAAQTLFIGGRTDGSSSMNGYISNARIVNGTAVYTATFTPSTTPLTAITNTGLLTCQTTVPQTTSVFVDESGQNNSITRNGNTNIGTFSPLNGSWSNYFDGTGDDLATPSSSAFAFGTGDFTAEGWVCITSAVGSTVGFWQNGTADSCNLERNTSGNLQAWDGAGRISTTPVPSNTWCHVAFCRSGATAKIFVNGVQALTWTSSVNYSASSTWNVGYTASGSYRMSGYISNVRVVKGTAVYTAAFTPPTAPLNSIANTSLLTCNSPSFVDYSPVNNVITRNGDTAVNKFSPFPGYITNFASYSGYFDGSGDYLSVPTNSALDFSTGDFTIEAWVYPNSIATDWFIISSSGSGGFFFGYNPGYGIGWGRTGVAWDYRSTGVGGTGTWQHMAVTRSGTSMKIFYNGTQVGTTQTVATAYNLGVTSTTIGSQGAAYYLNGYISNLRVVKGTAVYTSNFTPPTAPLTAIANTSLLTCQSTTFIDNSANALAITVNGNTKPVIQNPFVNTFTSPMAYSPTTTGSSMYFDGTGDYASYTGSLSLNGAFTVECWFYNTSTSGAQQGLFAFNSTSGAYASIRVDCDGGNASNQMQALLSTAGSAWNTNIGVTNAYVKGVWNHVAVTRDSSNLVRFFVNGVVIGTATQTGTLYNTSTIHGIGINALPGTPVNPFQGYISNLRMVAGTALYIAPFVPSNSPLPAVQNTVLLVSSTITPPVYDAAEINDIENVGASKLTTSNSPYYSSYSGYFDGTGDYLSIASNSVFQLGTGSYTFETWIFPTVLGVLNTNNIINIGTYITGLMLRVNGTTTGLQVYTNNTERLATSTGLVANTWQHIALVRNGSACTVYINGVVNGTFTDSSNISPATATLTIGMAAHNNSEFFTGYMSNYRLVKGTAVYTSAFTPPTAPLTAIANTSLLTCQSNRFIDNSTNAFAITRNGDAKVSALQPFGGSNLTKYSSVYFDGTGDSLKILNNPNINLGSGDFTLECWVYFNAVNIQVTIINKGWNSSSAYASYLIWMQNDATLRFLASSNGSSWDIANEKVMGTMTSGSWIHIAVTRSGTTFRAFVNGVINNSFTFTSSASLANIAAQTLFIGDRTNGDTSLNGYISDVRITNGYARYTTTFTPPTVPLLGF